MQSYLQIQGMAVILQQHVILKFGHYRLFFMFVEIILLNQIESIINSLIVEQSMWTTQNQQQTILWNGVKIILTSKIPNHLPLITISRFRQSDSYIIPDGEKHKTLEQMPKIFQFLLTQKCNRSSLINIKGGGMALDIGGFAASVFMRGIPCNYIPTTLLSMVDASVGGKTAVNYQSKNMLGTITQPKNVYINVGFLKTLDRRQFMNGMAQVIKMAYLYDIVFFRWLQNLDKAELFQKKNLEHIIKQSIRLKISVVNSDVMQKHQRKWLNFGHTIGHAIQYMYEPDLKHGECVAIGMVQANKIAYQMGILQSQSEINILKELLQKFQLPTEFPKDFNSQGCMKLLERDKKGSFNFVLAHGIGKPCKQVTEVPRKILLQRILPFHVKSIHSDFSPLESKSVPELHQQLFPNSKSLSIRYLYACALSVLADSKRKTIIGCLMSDDTKIMIQCLKSIGFKIQVDGNNVSIEEFNKARYAKINVGNSGLTARFILPLCALLKSEYQINCEQRMKRRPNQQLFRLLKIIGANIEHYQFQSCFPIKMHPAPILFPESLEINGKQSSQYLSSFLMLSIINKMPKLKVTDQDGELVSEGFITMTLQTLKQFSIQITKKDNQFTFTQDENFTSKKQFTVEVDYAGLSYPYIFRKLNNLSLPSISASSVQGDALFYKYIDIVSGTTENYLQLDFNNCTDTFMSMIVYVVCHKPPTFTLRIFNIENQRKKQSNRINAMVVNIGQVADIQQQEDGITVRGGFDLVKIQRNSVNENIIFESFNDHRVCMSMAILAQQLKNLLPSKIFLITEPECVNKTFPTFWKWLSTQNINTAFFQTKQYLNILREKTPQSYYLIGMRGCGKSTYGKKIAQRFNLKFMQMDQIASDLIYSKFRCRNIKELVIKHGWEKFREVETDVLKMMVQQKDIVVATGGGVVEKQFNRQLLSRQECIYVQKQFQDLLPQFTDSRPDLQEEMLNVFQRRRYFYQSLAKTIITVPKGQLQQNSNFFIEQLKRKYFKIPNWFKFQQNLKGFIVCADSFKTKIEFSNYDGVQWRIDKLMLKHSLRDIRFQLAQIAKKNSKIPTILTLRTENQYGSFDRKKYQSVHQQIQKIPCQYVDCQIINIPLTKPVSNPLWSYHGSQTRWLQQMKYRDGLKKVVLEPLSNLKYLQQKYRKDFDMFWTMGEQKRPTRLDNTIKMVVNNQIQSPLGIMTKSQFIQLAKLLGKYVK